MKIEVLCFWPEVGPRGGKRLGYGWRDVLSLPTNARIHIVGDGFAIDFGPPFRVEQVPPYTPIRFN